MIRFVLSVFLQALSLPVRDNCPVDEEVNLSSEKTQQTLTTDQTSVWEDTMVQNTSKRTSRRGTAASETSANPDATLEDYPQSPAAATVSGDGSMTSVTDAIAKYNALAESNKASAADAGN